MAAGPQPAGVLLVLCGRPSTVRVRPQPMAVLPATYHTCELGATMSIHEGLMKASSLGSYFQANIRDAYQYTKAA